jgi:hypothetical protein
VGRGQGGGDRRDPRRRRHDHAPPRGRARPSRRLGGATAGAVRGGAARHARCVDPARILNPGVLFET